MQKKPHKIPCVSKIFVKKNERKSWQKLHTAAFRLPGGDPKECPKAYAGPHFDKVGGLVWLFGSIHQGKDAVHLKINHMVRTELHRGQVTGRRGQG